MNYNEFTSAINEHTTQLMNHALKFTKDEDDAKDLLQETLIKGVRFKDKFDDGTNLKGWLYVIMKNTYINDFNRNARRNQVISVQEDLNSSHLLKSATRNNGESTFALEDIRKAMSSIKDDYRVPFQRYFEGYKYEEIAVELNIPIGTVKTYIHQARLGLKKYLKMYR
ncbi:RNA polymerase sigma factor [Pedobacter sandarakinus]|uniref:RNA polymerase sigma factor n=1 Tax=Pedobacter sandarakinus TaxID=353156 RepID=UPI0022480B2C|nr:RNA polymerase sigma factor [Pedobacter sandarakinus]MCX2573318.1 RNA polymerase sigma factor [Pedobacter sandarakinus]